LTIILNPSRKKNWNTRAALSPAYVVVVGIAPKLPVIIGREHVFIQPHGPPLALTHLLAIRRRDEGRRHSKHLQIGANPE
jgi:hypothetical protein